MRINANHFSSNNYHYTQIAFVRASLMWLGICTELLYNLGMIIDYGISIKGFKSI